MHPRPNSRGPHAERLHATLLREAHRQCGRQKRLRNRGKRAETRAPRRRLRSSNRSAPRVRAEVTPYKLTPAPSAQMLGCAGAKSALETGASAPRRGRHDGALEIAKKRIEDAGGGNALQTYTAPSAQMLGCAGAGNALEIDLESAQVSRARA